MRSGALFLAIPAGFCSPHINMCKCAINPNPAFIWHQGFRICSYLFRRHSCNLNICGSAVLVLWECCPTDILVVRRSAVGGCDCQGPSKMRAYFLQYLHQLWIYEYRIGTVLVKKYSRKSKQYCLEPITKRRITLHYMVIRLFIFCYRKETSGTSLPLVSSLLFCCIFELFFIKKSDFRLTLI